MQNAIEVLIQDSSDAGIVGENVTEDEPLKDSSTFNTIGTPKKEPDESLFVM